MIRYSRRGAEHVSALLDHYIQLERPEAVRNLLAAVREAMERIERSPDAGLPAPRPYLQLRSPGRFWIQVGSYWIAYRRRPVPTIVAVFYDESNIPGRL